jgi:RimJ/RimL family protein N-acetyltransferase
MTTENYGCRRTIKKDVPFWKEVYSDIKVQEYMALWGSKLQGTDMEIWAHLNSIDRYVVYKQQKKKEIPVGGFSFYNKENNTAHFGIVIHPTLRGQGVGKIVMEHLLATAKDIGIKTLKGEVFEDNISSLFLLRKNGFRNIILLEKNLKDE